MQIKVFMSPPRLYIQFVSGIDITRVGHSRVKVGRLLRSYYRHLLAYTIPWSCARITRQSGNFITIESRIV